MGQERERMRQVVQYASMRASLGEDKGESACTRRWIGTDIDIDIDMAIDVDVYIDTAMDRVQAGVHLRPATLP